VIKGYTLPKTVNNNTLVVPISISGNTVETISALKQAKNEQDCKIIAFSSGGKIEDFCKENKIDFNKVEKIHSPRASFVKYIYSLLKILYPILPITSSEVLDSIIQLKQTKKNIYSGNIFSNNPSLELANWITSIPLIYYPDGLESAATRFKNSLQENAKIHATKEEVLEACHNNIVSWETKSEIKPVLLRGLDDHPKTKERWKILKDFFNDKNIEFKEVFSTSGNILTKLVNLIYLLDYTSIYLAMNLGIDPTPIKSIDYIKRKL
jgi:glucose/mannose-6-phosphate isomerase